MTNPTITKVGKHFLCEGDGISLKGQSAAHALRMWERAMRRRRSTPKGFWTPEPTQDATKVPARTMPEFRPWIPDAAMRDAMHRAHFQPRLMNLSTSVRSFADTGNVRTA